MNIKTRQFGFGHAFAASFLLAALLLFSQLGASRTAVAQEANCANKINQDKCVEEIKQCQQSGGGGDRVSASCSDKAKRYAEVIDPCKGKQRPQACHEAVKDSCDSKSGGAKTSCQKDRAEDFSAAKSPDAGGPSSLFDEQKEGSGGGRCGNEQSGSSVKTKFNLGCLGNEGPPKMGAIEDLVYSIVRFLTAGVGIVLVGGMILAGIQYSASQGNPEATKAAKDRIQNIIIGLMIYLFAFALVQYLVPGGLFAASLPAPPPPILQLMERI
jgi:hypothetical protein